MAACSLKKNLRRMASELVPKRNTKAPVWEYFGLEKDKDGATVDDGRFTCRICRRKVLARNGNTSNLTAHLRNSHPRTYSQLTTKQLQQVTTPAVRTSSSTCLNETEQMPIISVEQQVKSELDNYITASKLDFEEDPMNWWKSHNLEYPLLARLAKKYLCACATSLPSERLFSTSGNIVTPNRCSMKPDKVDMLTFLTRNL